MAQMIDLGCVIGPQGPKGDKGDTGETGAQGPKGDKGDTGAIGNLTINGQAPDANGSVSLAAEHIVYENETNVKQAIGQLRDESAAHGASVADAWTSGTSYAAGEYCISDNRLYKCNTAHTASGAFDPDCWDAVSLAGELSKSYEYRSDTLVSNYANIVIGGYVQIRNLVIANVRLQLTSSCGATVVMVSGFPKPYNSINHVPLCTDTGITGFLNSDGGMRFNTDIGSGKIVMISCAYLSR